MVILPDDFVDYIEGIFCSDVIVRQSAIDELAAELDVSSTEAAKELRNFVRRMADPHGGDPDLSVEIVNNIEHFVITEYFASREEPR